MPEQVLVERERIVSDIASVERGLAVLPTEVAAGRITQLRAECVSAQWNEELRRLTGRLADLDASISFSRTIGRPLAGHRQAQRALRSNAPTMPSNSKSGR
jgi:hypothetical protein